MGNKRKHTFIIIPVLIIACFSISYRFIGKYDDSKESKNTITKNSNTEDSTGGIPTNNINLSNNNSTINEKEVSKQNNKERLPLNSIQAEQETNLDFFSRDELLDNLKDLSENSSSDLSQVSQIAAELISMEDEIAFNEIIKLYKQSSNKDFSRELLKALERTDNPKLIDIYDSHFEKVVAEDDVLLASALAGGLCNMDDTKAVKIVLDAMANPETISEDMSYLIGQSLKNIKNNSSITLLSDFAREQIPGYEGAIEALLHLGGAGAYEVAELIAESDMTSDIRIKLDTVINKMDYDEETQLTFENLSRNDTEHNEIYQYIATQIKEKQ